jgi:hypothetical protein
MLCNSLQSIQIVPGTGIEPVLAFSANRILSPACLPVPPPGWRCENNSSINKKSIRRRRMDFFLSGRPGSNRPPRPWQGRALPNELLPQLFAWANYEKINLKSGRKYNAFRLNPGRTKRKFLYLYLGVYNVFPGTSTSGFPL